MIVIRLERKKRKRNNVREYKPNALTISFQTKPYSRIILFIFSEYILYCAKVGTII